MDQLDSKYIYIDSKILNKRIAIHKKTGIIFVDDKFKTRYSTKEIKLMGEVSNNINLVKGIFNGEVIGNYPTDDETNGQTYTP